LAAIKPVPARRAVTFCRAAPHHQQFYQTERHPLGTRWRSGSSAPTVVAGHRLAVDDYMSPSAGQPELAISQLHDAEAGVRVGGGLTGAMLNLQKEVLRAYDKASRARLARVKSEMDLWSGLAALSGMRSG